MVVKALAAKQPVPANPTCRRRGRSDLLASRYGSRTLSINLPLFSLLCSPRIRRTPERMVIIMSDRVCLAGRAAWWGLRDQLFGTGPLFDRPRPD